MLPSRPVLTTPRIASALLVVVVCFGLAACGSALNPDELAGNNNAGGQVGGSSTGSGGVDPDGNPVLGGGGLSGGSDTGGLPATGSSTGGTTSTGGSIGGTTGAGSTSTGSGGSTGSTTDSTGDTTGGTAGTGAGTGGSGGTSGDAGGSTGAQPPGGNTPSGSCDGFKNGTGITDSTITIGNAADISGPAPGLFEQSQQAVQAYVKYFNDSGTKICGRKLDLKTYDTKTDAGADQQAYTSGCADTFAMVGSMGAFDNGGAATAQSCGLPDIRAINTTQDRANCSTCYAAQPAGPNEFQNAVPDFIKRNFNGGQKAAMLYLNAGAASENAPSQVRLMTKRGMKFVVVQGIDTAEFNYTPVVQKLKDAGVETVMFIGAVPFFVRLAQAMQQNGYVPKAYFLDPTAYDPTYTESGGDAVKGTYVFLNFTPFEEYKSNPETQLYLSYLQQVNPSATPGFFGAFSWSAARLFVQQATKLGGKLSRQTLINSMKSVDNWTGNGLHAPEHVGAKRIGDCWRFIQWDGSAWQPKEGTKYQCTGTTR